MKRERREEDAQDAQKDVLPFIVALPSAPFTLPDQSCSMLHTSADLQGIFMALQLFSLFEVNLIKNKFRCSTKLCVFL